MAGPKGKREQRFSNKMQIKLTAVFAFVLLALLILLVRITVITATSGDEYAKQVLSQQSYDSRSIPYRRGEIRDRNGITLASSERVYNLILDCMAVNQNRDAYVQPTLDCLSEVFGLDSAKIRSLLDSEKTASSQYQILLKNVTEEQKQAYTDYKTQTPPEGLTEEAKKDFRSNRSNIQGIWFEEQYERSYPYDTFACKVIGFSNDIGDGITGVEAYYDSLLKGTDGRTFGYLNQDSEYERTTISPEHGKTLTLTLDMDIQKIVEKHIQEFDDLYGTEETRNKGAENIGVLVMDPDTGEILAMADNTEYNLNKYNDLTNYYTGAEIRAMSEATYVDTLSMMWENFCVSHSYEPGSVVKPMTVASALECGAVTDNDAFYCDGGEFVTDTQINCDNVYGHGDETLEYAIVNSCNDALMQIAAKIGITRFCNYQKLFNFGSPTGIDLPAETTGVVYTENSMHEVELATCSFGQGFTLSMVQEAAAFSTVINGGYYYQPHVLKQVQDANGVVEKTVQPLVLKQPVSSQVSALLRRYLTTAVQEGTGRKSQVPGYLTGGKTGTAEKINPQTHERDPGKYLVSFIGACPMDDPEVVIYVIVDEPNVAQQADSTYAQKLFADIATEVFPSMGLYPTEPVTSQLLAYLGLTEDDVVQGGDTGLITFQAFDKYGNLYNDAYVNEDGVVVSAQGNALEGAYLNDDGNVVDGYGNVITVKKTNRQTEEVIDPVAENPDIAHPPEDVDLGSTQENTVWSGVTGEDLGVSANDNG